MIIREYTTDGMVVHTKYGKVKVVHYASSCHATILTFDNKDYMVELLKNECDIAEIETIVSKIKKEKSKEFKGFKW